MKEINYLSASNTEDALSLLSGFGENAKIIAGGTDILVRLKDNVIKEDTLIDISGVRELKGIYEDKDIIHILPLTTHTDIIESPVICKHLPILRDAVKSIGSPQIRNRGTIGGNIANASPAGDSIPALYVLSAYVRVKSREKERMVSINEFYKGPGQTVLDSNEMIVDIVIPHMKEQEIGFFRKVGQRNAISIAIANVAVKLEVSGENRFSNASVAFGALAPTVLRAKLIENALLNEVCDSPEKLLYISKLSEREVSPITDIRGSASYRIEMSTNILYEGLLLMFLKGWKR